VHFFITVSAMIVHAHTKLNLFFLGVLRIGNKPWR
jgi:hypothetical protein